MNKLIPGKEYLLKHKHNKDLKDLRVIVLREEVYSKTKLTSDFVFGVNPEDAGLYADLLDKESRLTFPSITTSHAYEAVATERPVIIAPSEGGTSHVISLLDNPTKSDEFRVKGDRIRGFPSMLAFKDYRPSKSGADA